LRFSNINQLQNNNNIQQKNNLLLLLIKKIGQVGFNSLENIILPSKLSLLLSSRNQIIVGILLNKIGISANIISIILLFL